MLYIYINMNRTIVALRSKAQNSGSKKEKRQNNQNSDCIQ